MDWARLGLGCAVNGLGLGCAWAVLGLDWTGLCCAVLVWSGLGCAVLDCANIWVTIGYALLR